MLLKFGFKNFYSFKEGAEVSFELPKSSPADISGGDFVSKILCIKGKNASGKTNLIKAVEFLHKFCVNSFDYKKDDGLKFDNYFSNDSLSEFYIEFESQVKNISYKYELEASETAVIRETLYRKKGALTKIIERKNNEFTHLTKDFSSLNVIKLKTNSSFLSTEKQYELDSTETLDDVREFFSRITSNVFSFGLVDEDYLKDYNTISKLYFEHTELFELTKSLISQFDTGINNIQILETKDEETDSVKYFPIFEYEISSGEQKVLTYLDQSHGTKALYKRLALYGLALNYGALLCMDEFDLHLHPDILPEILNLFSNPKINTKQAQLLFSTHDSDILDYMGKYRTYIVDKEENESFCYRVDEIPGGGIRNDRPLTPLYKSGKLGGVPQL